MNDANAQPPVLTALRAELTAFRAGAAVAAALPDDRRFYLWLLLAALAHALFLIGFHGSPPKRLGDPAGAENAISIDLVSSKDLEGATVAERAAGLPAPPPSPVPPPPQPAQPQAAAPPEPPALKPTVQPEAPPQRPEVASQPPAEPPPPPPSEVSPATEPVPLAAAPPVPETGLEPAPKPQVNPDPPKPPPPQPIQQAAKPVEKPATPEKPVAAEKPARPAKLPDAKPAEAKPQASPAPARTAKLDISPPPTIFTAPAGGGGAGLERPAGATRSGENDNFARGVIRALQITMPQLRDTFGRVTVRITLDRNGNHVSTQVLRPSSVAGLDQSVVFATRQASFPLPPRNAVADDLIFFVTYIYR
jgi:TonB family protein